MMKRKTPLRSKTPLRAKTGFKKKFGFLKPTRIKQTSDRRKKEYALYLFEKAKYLKDRPMCECCGKLPSVDIHHKAGREGKLLYAVKYFMAVSRKCHDWIESHRSQAEEKGWIIRRVKGTDLNRELSDSENSD